MAPVVVVTLLFGALANCRADLLYVSGTGTYTVNMFTGLNSGSVLAGVSYGEPFNEPYGLAVGSGGNLFVADGYNNTIEEYTPGGVGSFFASSPYLDVTAGLAFDSAGNLYACSEANGYIIEFTPAGDGSVFASGLNHPTFVTTVPEPTTFALIGLAGLSALLIRRQHNPVL
jgi:hypothetical protein